MKGRAGVFLAVWGVLALGMVLLRLAVGGDGLAWPESDGVWSLRLTRAASAVAVGAALAGSGVLLQCLLRNPLASPDIMGLASGSGLAVMISSLVASTAGRGAGAGEQGAAAVMGAAAVLGVVYAFSQRRGAVEPVSLVLVGVAVSVLCSAGTVAVQQFLPERGAEGARWMMGSLSDDTGRAVIAVIAAVTLAVISAAAWIGPTLDAATLSEDEARSVGVPLGALRAGLFVASGVLCAGAVVLAGPLGFVGLICPHVVRLGVGPRHRVLMVGAALAGATLVVGADTLVKGVRIAGGRLPIGVLTALIGAPVLIGMLRRSGSTLT